MCMQFRTFEKKDPSLIISEIMDKEVVTVFVLQKSMR